MSKKSDKELERSLEALQKEVRELREMVNFLVGYLMSFGSPEGDEEYLPDIVDFESTLKNNRFSM